jgi:hypothetical protein
MAQLVGDLSFSSLHAEPGAKHVSAASYALLLMENTLSSPRSAWFGLHSDSKRDATACHNSVLHLDGRERVASAEVEGAEYKAAQLRRGGCCWERRGDVEEAGSVAG